MRLTERVSLLSQMMRRRRWPLGVGAVTLIALVVLLTSPLARGPQLNGAAVATASVANKPPWRYGRPDARFTVIEYADLECPYCRAYFPVLKRWIDANPDVNWEWHHFPLAMHEPAATMSARLAECAGETGGNTAFWKAVAWIYRQTRSNGRGLPLDARFPDEGRPALRRCLASQRPDRVIRAQAEEATDAGIIATPTLRIVDHRRGTTLRLPAGPIEGDALSSAIDLLAASRDSPKAERVRKGVEKPADTLSSKPR